LDLRSIVTELKHERDRLSLAITALEETDSSPEAITPAMAPFRPAASGQRSRAMSPAARRRLSKIMKQRWAARKKKRS